MYQQSPQREHYLSYILSSSRKHTPPHGHLSNRSTQFIVTAETLRTTVAKIIEDIHSAQEQWESILEALLRGLEETLGVERKPGAGYQQRGEYCLGEVKERLKKHQQKQIKYEKELGWFNSKVKSQLKEIQKLKQQLRKHPREIEEHFQSRSKIEEEARSKQIDQGVGLSQGIKRGQMTLGTENSEDLSMLPGVTSFELDRMNLSQSSAELTRRRQGSLEKEYLLQMLGQKCLQLQGHIQKLTRRYIGDISIGSRQAEGRVSPQPVVVRKKSEVQLSSALVVQKQDDI